MFPIDDKFLQDLGLNELPEDQKQPFLDHIYSELELRVGMKLSEGLSEEQLKEFESFIDRDMQKVREWIALNAPNYVSDPAYVQLTTVNPPSDDSDDADTILAEYASLKWLSLNRSNYREVVAQVLNELKQEIVGSKDALLG